MGRVFLHGLGQQASSWDQVISALGEGADARRPSLLDLSDGQRMDYEAVYRGFCRYCQGLQGPLDLCGLSLGAVLALQYALDHPQRTRSLVLIAGQYKVPRGLILLQNAAFRLMPEAAFRQMGLGKAQAMNLASSTARLDFSGDLERVACPVLVVVGEKDRANQGAARQLAGRIPGATLRVIEGAGHTVNQDAPQALAAAIAGFDRERAGSAGEEREG